MMCVECETEIGSMESALLFNNGWVCIGCLEK